MEIQEDTVVEKAPEFVEDLEKEMIIKPGEQKRLKVKAKGKPKPKVSWFKDGSEIKPSPEFIIEDFEDGTSILTITEIYPDDVGEVTVVAENPLGTATTTTILETEGLFHLFCLPLNSNSLHNFLYFSFSFALGLAFQNALALVLYPPFYIKYKGVYTIKYPKY